MQTIQLAKKSRITKLFAAFALLFAGLGQADAQPFAMVNNGTMVYVNNGAQMIVNGPFFNNDSIFINRGHTIVTEDFTNNTGAICGGTGIPLPINVDTLEVWGDWWNHGLFNSGTGVVYLNGAGDQIIRGDSVTRFYDLEIDNAGIKYQDTNAVVKNRLELNDRELATDKYTMFVTNPLAGAITRGDSGFVSSLEEGSLSRVTNNTVSYIFPVGSSLFQQYRYRPAFIEPDDIATNVYTVRMVNANPSPAPPNGPGYDITLHDDSICYVNPDYWYKVKQTSGTTTASLGLSYRWENEGAYNGIARWDLNQNPQQWYSLNSPFWDQDHPTTPNGVTVIHRTSWNDFDPTNSAYTLVYRTPYPPEVEGPRELCAREEADYTAIVGTNDVNFVNSTFEWTVINGEIADSTNQTVGIIWNDVDSGYIIVTETASGFYSYNGTCPSFTDTVVRVDIWPLPASIFGTTYQYNNGLPINPDDLLFENELVSFLDSSTNTETWFWDFGDNSTSTYQNPFHTYGDTGTYTVMMVATSPDGCLDTSYTDITVSEGLIVPNVFTPDGDGYNDVFTLRNSNVVDFKLQIYNRWGNLIYETQAPQVSWDGKTTAGIDAPAGTYFWTIEAGLGSGKEFTTNAADYPFKNTGYVQLIR